MQKAKSWQTTLLAYLSLVITGFGIGWLVGLSVSPVVSVVITSVTGSAAAVIAAMSGIEGKEDKPEDADKVQTSEFKWNVTPFPIAMLVIGLIVGSTFGILARNHNWMGSGLSSELERWTNAGLDEKEVIRRLFDSEYPSTNSTESVPKGSYLFAVSSEECGRLRGAPDEGLPNVMATSGNKLLQYLSEAVKDQEVLREVANILCESP
jgi:hypothetical protein